MEGPDSMLSSSAASGGMRLVERKTLGSIANAFDFQNLSILTGRIYKLYVYAENDTANGSVCSIYINNDTTATNYYSQLLEGNNAVTAAVRANNAQCGYIQASGTFCSEYTIFRSPDGYVSITCMHQQHRGASVYYDAFSMTKTLTVTNITRLAFFSDQNMKVGSTAALYAMP